MCGGVSVGGWVLGVVCVSVCGGVHGCLYVHMYACVDK